MDYDQESDSRGLHSGVFYGAAAFIFVLIALFASFVIDQFSLLNLDV